MHQQMVEVHILMVNLQEEDGALESTNHINFLELFAIFLALKYFFSSNTMYHHIGIKSDNPSAVAYINNMGGMTSQSKNQLAIDIWNWCTDHHLFISAQYLPGVLNSNADFMSRVFSDNCEWALKRDIFIRICNNFHSRCRFVCINAK